MMVFVMVHYFCLLRFVDNPCHSEPTPQVGLILPKYRGIA